jgi:SUF system NifU family Fe-S assembly protein
MSTLDNLYREIIMEHYKNPRNKGLIKNEEYTNARIKNTACGDDITFSTKVENGMVIDCKQQAAGCSISVASASVMTEIMIGKTKENALEIANTFLNMVSNQEYDQSIDLEEAEVFGGVKQFPARIKCASIAWVAFKDTLSQE